jgi:hypothetical protein
MLLSCYKEYKTDSTINISSKNVRDLALLFIMVFGKGGVGIYAQNLVQRADPSATGKEQDNSHTCHCDADRCGKDAFHC